MAAKGRHPNELLRRARGARSQASIAELANAEIYRRTGRPGTLAALSDAERTLDRAHDDSAGEWVSHFDAASLASEVAWCLHRLDDQGAAQRYAQTAIDLRTGDRVRSRTFAQLALAEILLTSGEVEQAARLGDHVRATVHTLTSARVRTQLADLAGRLVPYRASATVADFLATVGSVTAGPTLVEESA